ncbi:MAG: S41 family peptidase [Bauldia sp.]
MTIRHAGRVAALLLIVPLWMAPAGAEVPKSGNNVVDAAVALIDKNLYSPAALPAFHDAATALIDDAKGARIATSAGIDALIASLHVSHSGRYTPDQVDYYDLSDVFRFNIRDLARKLYPPRGEVVYEGIGIASKVIDGHRFVTDVFDGMPAIKARIKAGDEILSADGKPFEEIGSFNHKTGQTVALEVRHTADAAPVTIPVSVEKTSPLATYMEAVRESARVIDQNGRKIGYVHLWTGAGDLTGVLNEVLATKLKDVDGMVVDMRSRWGGGPADGAETFVGGSADMTITENDGKTQYVNTRFHKPVVAIIDEGTRSSMEIMAYGLKKNGIALVGAPTAGDVLAARAFALPDDSLLELPVADVMVDGQRLEGSPVTPTVPVAFDVRYANGADPQMDAALVELGKKLAAAVN